MHSNHCTRDAARRRPRRHPRVRPGQRRRGQAGEPPPLADRDSDLDRRESVGRRVAHRDSDHHLVRGQPRRQHDATDEERRVPRLRRPLPLRRPRVRRSRALRGSARRSATGTISRPPPTTAASSSTRGTTAARRSCSSPTPAACSTTPSPTTAARARTPRRTSTGTPPARSPPSGWTPGDPRSPSRRCATRRRTRRPGASCSTGTTLATSATSS